MGVCNRCGGTGRVKGKKQKCLFMNETYRSDVVCPKCGGSGQVVSARGPLGTGYNSQHTQGGKAHHTLYAKNSNDHISWDTDRKGNHIGGSGHRDKDGKKIGKNW